MSNVQEKLEKLRRFNAEIGAVDSELAVERGDLGADVIEESAFGEDAALEQESIVMRRQRPVLAIRNNRVELEFRDRIDSEVWKARLEQAMPALDKAVRAVGRIELVGGRLDWVGTGWLVHDSIMVTNRHVASEFAARGGDGFTFRMGADGEVAASVDFLQEVENPATLVFTLVKPLYIEESPGPDLAFFEIAMTSGDDRLAERIILSQQPAATENVAVIGYPAYDSRIPEPDLMDRIYGRVYDKKRLAPGAVTAVDERRLSHNCTTLGGNSGSVLLDLDRGEAIGLHYSGSFLAANYAVRSDIVLDRLERLRSGRLRVETALPRPPAPPGPHLAVGPATGSVLGQLVIPLTVTITAGHAAAGLTLNRPAIPARPQAGPFGDEIDGEEARVEDYRERDGYLPDFLGVDVPLPRVDRDAADLLKFQLDGRPETELRYEHFSVLINRRRRMCFFSAVNINGALSKPTRRTGWRWDPRVPREMQIMNECYGDPPRFSRGHMTRREDPAWGDDPIAHRGNADSMHVTNVAPQMQAFNSPIWLALEDYALDHAREDDMNISVFTGPYFDPRDPEMYGVRIPLAFWKIIAFIHERTGRLCATGYEMNQEQSLVPEQEYVFGGFTSPQLGKCVQVPIRSIAERSGIVFGDLVTADPLFAEQEGIAGPADRPPLLALDQIRFVM